MTQFPDVEKKVTILSLSDPIINDPIVFRKDMPEEMKDKITEAMISFLGTPEGKAAFTAIYGITEVKKATDADYDSARVSLQAVREQAEEAMRAKK